jgi:hypothetical protein
MKEKAIEIFDEQGAAAAIEFLKSQEDIAEAVNTFDQVSRHTYWDLHDLDTTIELIQAGIAYGAEQSKGADKDTAYKILSGVKGMNYNLAAFVWPGWDEDWIDEIKPEYLKLGLEAAKSNLHYAVDLEKGDLRISRAHWMLGAMQLCYQQYDEARDNFSQGATFGEKAESSDDALLCKGFVQATNLLENPDDEIAKAELEQVKAELKKSENGEFYIKQLDDTLRVFG